MEQSEREFLIGELEASRERLLASVAGLPPERWAEKPAPERWSVAECVEHLVNVERRVKAGIDKALEHPADPAKLAQAAENNRHLDHIASREDRFQAPEPAQPKGGGDPLAWRDEFMKERQATIQFCRETSADLSAHTFPHGRFGELACHQWLLLLARHVERHTAQIEEVKDQLAGRAAATPAG